MPKITEEINPDETPAPDVPAVETPAESPAPEAAEVLITIGDPPAEPAPESPESAESKKHGVAAMRERIKELNRLDKERREEIERLRKQVNPEPEVGPEPTLAECGYDEAKFKAELLRWNEGKRKVEEKAAAERRQQEENARAWEDAQKRYATAKTALQVEDFEDAEVVVDSLFNNYQRGLLISGPDKPAEVVYALGKNPEEAKKLAAITDPVKFAFAVAKLEANVRVTERKRPTPERVVASTGPTGGSPSETLERLRAEAETTNDYTRVKAFLKEQRQRAS